MTPTAKGHHDVVVVGAGISGVGAALRLRGAGVRDVVVLEKAHGYGGTWRANTYPGCACDVPSALYSFSFAPNPGWSRLFARQEEILRYVTDVARTGGLDEVTRFGVELLEATWDDAAACWHVRTTAGELTCRFLVAGAGPWNEPAIPDVPGLASFPGPMFHSARWDHDAPLDGKRVAVVGSGASAVQFVPHVQRRVAELHHFQRTVQWVLPRLDAPVPAPVRALLRLPGAMATLRSLQYGVMEGLGLGFRHPTLMRAVEAVGRAHLRASVHDPELRRTLTPSYTAGCKRLLFSNDYLPALARDNVTVHATAVAEVDGPVVLGADGTGAEVDVLVLGTGFHILDMPLADRVVGAAGRTLAQRWRGSPEAYLGTVVHGFPNAFLLLGPNLGTGHSSAFTILEAQLDLLVDAVTSARRSGWAAIDVHADVQARYNARVQEALATTVYNAGGCSSYYLDRNGRNSATWPWSTPTLARRVARFDARDFAVRPAQVISAPTSQAAVGGRGRRLRSPARWTSDEG